MRGDPSIPLEKGSLLRRAANRNRGEKESRKKAGKEERGEGCWVRYGRGGEKKGRRAGVRDGLQKGLRVRRSALRAANGDAEQARDEEGERKGGEIGAKILSPFRSSSRVAFFCTEVFFLSPGFLRYRDSDLAHGVSSLRGWQRARKSIC